MYIDFYYLFALKFSCNFVVDNECGHVYFFLFENVLKFQLWLITLSIFMIFCLEKKWWLDICSSYIRTSSLLIRLFRSSISLTICHVIVHCCEKCVNISLLICFYWTFLYIFWSKFWYTKVHDYHFSWWIGNFMKVKGLTHLMFCCLLILLYISSF